MVGLKPENNNVVEVIYINILPVQLFIIVILAYYKERKT